VPNSWVHLCTLETQHIEATMRQDQDFDFRIGRGYYRGRGVRGLAALAIVQLPRIALLGAGLLARLRPP
jgi:hypothetical protein